MQKEFQSEMALSSLVPSISIPLLKKAAWHSHTYVQDNEYMLKRFYLAISTNGFVQTRGGGGGVGRKDRGRGRWVGEGREKGEKREKERGEGGKERLVFQIFQQKERMTAAQGSPAGKMEPTLWSPRPSPALFEPPL